MYVVSNISFYIKPNSYPPPHMDFRGRSDILIAVGTIHIAQNTMQLHLAMRDGENSEIIGRSQGFLWSGIIRNPLAAST